MRETRAYCKIMQFFNKALGISCHNERELNHHAKQKSQAKFFSW